MTSSSAKSASETSLEETALPESRISISNSMLHPLAGRVELISIQDVTDRIDAAEAGTAAEKTDASNSNAALPAPARTDPLIVPLPRQSALQHIPVDCNRKSHAHGVLDGPPCPRLTPVNVL